MTRPEFVDCGERPSDPTRSKRRLVRACLYAALLLIVGTGIALVQSRKDPDESDVPGRPNATVWVKSSTRRVDEDLRLEVDPREVVLRDGRDEIRPGWLPMASKIDTTITQTGDETTAPQAVTGAITYMAVSRRLNLLELGWDTELVSCTFEFTGEFVQADGGTRWWRLARVRVNDNAGIER